MFAAVAPGAAGGGAKAGADGDVGQARQLRQADAGHPPQRFTLPLRAVGGVGRPRRLAAGGVLICPVASSSDTWPTRCRRLRARVAATYNSRSISYEARRASRAPR
ncbi:hypothetical protein G6F22_015229 [Rhizopus arrhizus]|nr:hypothetical protein G6F22_015229 [Rhizopus arrhizus]